MPTPNSQDLVAIPYNEGVLIVGLGTAIPVNLRRYALTSAPLAYSRLAAATSTPGSKRQLREIVARVTTRHFTRDSDLLTFVSQAGAAVNHQLLVVQLSPDQIVLEQRQEPPRAIAGIGSMDLTERFWEVLKRVPGHMPSELGEQFKAMLTPTALGTMAATFALWAGAHALGGVPGLAIDALLVGVGIFFIGMGVFEVARCIVDAISITVTAGSESDLDQAAARLARAFIVAGVTAIMALITKAQAKRVGQQYRQMQQAKQAPKAPPKEPAREGPKPPEKPAGTKPKATPEQRAKLDEIQKKVPGAKEEIDLKAQQVADEFGGKVAKAPPKSEGRVLEKANSDYGGDVTRVKDYARNTIVVDESNKMGALGSLKEKYPGLADKNITVVDAAKDPCGYSGIKVNVPTKSGLMSETQINSPEMIFAKEKPVDARAILGNDVYENLAGKPGMPQGGLGHQLYEQYRVLDPKSVEAQQVANQSRTYYDAVRTAAKGGG